MQTNRCATVEQLTAQMNEGTTNTASTMTIQRMFLRMGLRSRCLCWIICVCWLLFIGDKGWNLHTSTATGYSQSGNKWLFQMNYILYFMELMDISIYEWNVWKLIPCNNCWRVQAGGGNVVVWGILLWYSLDTLINVKDTMDHHKYTFVLVDHFHTYMRIVFPQNDSMYQQDNMTCHTACHAHEWFREHQDEFIILSWLANSFDLSQTKICEINTIGFLVPLFLNCIT